MLRNPSPPATADRKHEETFLPNREGTLFGSSRISTQLSNNLKSIALILWICGKMLLTDFQVSMSLAFCSAMCCLLNSPLN